MIMDSDILSDKSIQLIRDKIESKLGISKKNMPDDVNISTMTLEAKFNTYFYPWNIRKFIKKSNNGIINIVSKKDKIISGENDNKIKKNKPINKQNEIFLNQVTVNIAVSNKENPVSVKIFNSGTLHFTGCINIDNFIEAAYKLCVECRKEIAVINKNNKIVDIKFAKDPEQLYIENLYDYKVDMINCKFNAPFTIDRPSLQILLKADGYNASYDSNSHAGVKIKYFIDGKKVTIFVFESGAIIIILGNQGSDRILEVYNFIYKYILTNYELIVKDDDITVNSILTQFCDDTSSIDLVDIKKIEKSMYSRKGQIKKIKND